MEGQSERTVGEEAAGCTHLGRKGSEQIYRYLKVWCIATGLRWTAEASCTIGQVSYCLLGEGALGDVGVMSRGQSHTHGYTLSCIHTKC